MPLDKFVLILLSVIAAAAITVFGGAWLFGFFIAPLVSLSILIPISVLAYVIVRLIGDRVNSDEDDYYDGIEK